MKLRHVLLLASLVVSSAELQAQNLSDAVRVMRDPLPVGPRSTGMNRSLIAGIRDYTALDLNPAAIAAINFREFGLTLAHRQQSSLASFLGTTRDASIGSTDLASIGFGFKVPADRGHFAWGISYDRIADYTNSYSFKAVNNNSSYLNTRGFIDDPGISRTETLDDYRDYLTENNLAWYIYLTEDIDSANTALTTRLKSGLEESGTVVEEGGMNALRFGAGVDIAEGISIGGTMNVLFGNYEYRRVLEITDVNSLFANESGTAPNGFRSVEIVDTRTQSQAGLNLKLGLLVYSLDLVRVGLTIETPTWLSIEDSRVISGSSRFNSGERFESETRHEPLIVNDYDLTTPFKFGGGVSFHLPNTTIGGSATYYDASQVEFGNSDFLGNLNDRTRQEFVPVLSWSVGAEHVIPLLGLAIRAGYGMEGSPYEMDTDPAYDIRSLTAGLSVLLSKNTAIDLAYRRTAFTTDHLIYSDETPEGQSVRAIVDRDDVTRNAFYATFGYRF